MKKMKIRFLKRNRWDMKWKEYKVNLINYEHTKLGACKIYLSRYDDKRYTLDDGIESLEYRNTDLNLLFSFIQKTVRNFWSGQFSYFDCVRYFWLKIKKNGIKDRIISLSRHEQVYVSRDTSPVFSHHGSDWTLNRQGKIFLRI